MSLRTLPKTKTSLTSPEVSGQRRLKMLHFLVVFLGGTRQTASRLSALKFSRHLIPILEDVAYSLSPCSIPPSHCVQPHKINNNHSERVWHKSSVRVHCSVSVSFPQGTELGWEREGRSWVRN